VHRKVARFIVAEASDSTLQLAADGKLPELHLEEGTAKEKLAAASASMNPLILVGGLCAAAVLWGVLILTLMQSPTVSGSAQKDQARFQIETKFFGSGNIEDKSLQPYQKLLREAQRAHTSGDKKTEHSDYRQVLDMLRAERGTHEKGLTGSPERDKELEDAISVLLSE